MQTLKPDIVAVELCKSRISILQLDEETLLKEAQTMDFQKAHLAVKQVIHHLLQLSAIGIRTLVDCIASKVVYSLPATLITG